MLCSRIANIHACYVCFGICMELSPFSQILIFIRDWPHFRTFVYKFYFFLFYCSMGSHTNEKLHQTCEHKNVHAHANLWLKYLFYCFGAWFSCPYNLQPMLNAYIQFHFWFCFFVLSSVQAAVLFEPINWHLGGNL